MLCHGVYFSVCKALDETHLLRNLISELGNLRLIWLQALQKHLFLHLFSRNHVMWSDIWKFNVSYTELGIWNQVSYDNCSYERNCLNCVHITAEAVGAGELKRFKDFTGIQRHGSKFASHKSRSMHFVRTLDDRIIVLQWVIMIILMEDLFIILTKNALSGKGNQDIAWTAIISFCNVNYCLFKSFLFLHIELPFLKGGRQWFLRC